MADKQTAYANAKKAFEALGVGQKVSALELANIIGATISHDRKTVAAFLSQQAQRGRAQKHVGADRRMYYEKITPAAKSASRKVAPAAKKEKKDVITFGEIGEGIVDYIEKLKRKVEDLEKEREQFKEKLTLFSKQKEEFKKLYQDAEKLVKELSAKQPTAQKTIRLSKLMDS
jgi:hypothetical protein